MQRSKTVQIWFEFRNFVYLHDFAQAEKLLEADPRLLNMRNSLGETVLHFLAVENDIEGVAWLFSKGAELNTKSDFGDPAIFDTALLGYKELFLWFVENGADIDIGGRNGESLVAYLEYHEKVETAEWVQQVLSIKSEK